jgi:hypothetical protein
MGRRPNAAGPIAAVLIFAGLLSVRPVVAEVPVCSATAAQTVCSCDLTMLRPLQGAVGIEEVAYKEKKISKHADREREKLKADPIKVLAGPDGQLFIIDHHHGAKAWLQSGAKEAFCQVVNSEKDLPRSFEKEEQFWALLEKARLVRLKDERGLDIKPSQLPKTLDVMPDDPYRSLAWLVRENGGFCKSPREFVEFDWADWFRSKFPNLDNHDLPSDPKDKENQQTVNDAVKFAHSQEAKSLPGYSDTDCKIEKEDGN